MWKVRNTAMVAVSTLLIWTCSSCHNQVGDCAQDTSICKEIFQNTTSTIYLGKLWHIEASFPSSEGNWDLPEFAQLPLTVVQSPDPNSQSLLPNSFAIPRISTSPPTWVADVAVPSLLPTPFKLGQACLHINKTDEIKSVPAKIITIKDRLQLASNSIVYTDPDKSKDGTNNAFARPIWISVFRDTKQNVSQVVMLNDGKTTEAARKIKLISYSNPKFSAPTQGITEAVYGGAVLASLNGSRLIMAKTYSSSDSRTLIINCPPGAMADTDPQCFQPMGATPDIAGNLFPALLKGLFVESIDAGKLLIIYADQTGQLFSNQFSDTDASDLSVKNSLPIPNQPTGSWQQVIISSGTLLSGSKHIVVLYKGTTTSTLKVYSIDANGALAELSNLENALTNAIRGSAMSLPSLGAIAVGDLDGDSLADIAVATGRQIVLAINLGNGAFQLDGSMPQLPAGSNPVSSLAIGDVDGQPGNDLAVAIGADFKIHLFLNSLPSRVSQFTCGGPSAN